MQQAIPVFRPTYLTDANEFQASLIESPANIFYQKVNASRATLNRMQFQWRSVSDNLLMSPVVMLRFQLKITCPQLWNQVLAYINMDRVVAGRADGANLGITIPAASAQAADGGGMDVQAPSIAFADGDAFMSCCSSANFVYNGTSLSLNRCNRYWRDFVRTQISSDDAAIIYKSAGGAYDKRDQRGCAIAQGTAAGPMVAGVGITDDSGVSDRVKSLYSLLHAAETVMVPAATGIEGSSRILQVSYPVPIAPLNPWRGHKVANSCPYSRCPLAIPHLSAGSLDFLLEDFATGFIRRLGGSMAVGGAVALPPTAAILVNNIGQNDSTQPLKIELVDSGFYKPYLEIKYYRLSHTRSLKDAYRFNVWQAQTFLGPVTPSADTAGFVEKYKQTAHAGSGLVCLDASGKDVVTSTAHATAIHSSLIYNKANKWTIQFDVLNLAQVPSYLLISVPKLGESYSHATNHKDAPNCVRNLSTNLSIRSLKIVVNSARGAIDKSEDDNGFIDAERLWQMTRENCTSDYFKEGGFRAWRDYGCAVLLASPQFAPGLQACDGIAYPVQIQIEMVVENRATDVIANAMTAGLNGVRTAACHSLAVDYIRAQAQATAIFTKVVLSATATSATTNALNYPLDAAERLFNVAGMNASVAR